MSFGDALGDYEDSIIDLLYIGGFHSYKSVKEYFNSWLPKMGNTKNILWDDIHVQRNSSGVYGF